MSSQTLPLTLIFAMHFALAGIANCQTIEHVEPLSALANPPTPARVGELPFVSGHSQAPLTTRMEYEYKNDCHRCAHKRHCNCKKRSFHTRLADYHNKNWGRSDLFCERPFGSYLRSAVDAQISRGISAQMVLYRYDFFDADQAQADMLKLAGRRNVARIAEFWSISPSPIMLESTGDPHRDAIRRSAVLTALVEMSVSVADDEIVMISRDPFGVSAEEAILTHGDSLRRAGSPQRNTSSDRGAGFGFPLSR